jgi:hypothetical protein
MEYKDKLRLEILEYINTDDQKNYTIDDIIVHFNHYANNDVRQIARDLGDDYATAVKDHSMFPSTIAIKINAAGKSKLATLKTNKETEEKETKLEKKLKEIELFSKRLTLGIAIVALLISIATFLFDQFGKRKGENKELLKAIDSTNQTLQTGMQQLKNINDKLRVDTVYVDTAKPVRYRRYRRVPYRVVNIITEKVFIDSTKKDR